ncbi:MAG: hypothetical protein ACYDAL_02065 [Candidatus Dormibacteraceae bacterium]
MALTITQPSPVNLQSGRLDRIPAQLLTPEFRAAVLEYAQAVAQHRLRAEAIQRASEAAAAFVSAGKFDEAGEANARRVGIEQLQLPAPGLSPSLVEEPLRRAWQFVAQAERDMGAVPAVRYIEELEAWRRLPIEHQQREMPPVRTAVDREAADLAKGLAMLRKPILDEIATWREMQGKNPDPVAQIETAVGIAEKVAEYLPNHIIIAEKIEAANKSRLQEAGASFK